MPQLSMPLPSRMLAVVVLVAGAFGLATAQELPSAVCDLVIHEEQIELEDARLAVSVARSDFAAYERIFAMIEELWEGDAIDRMTYIEARYDRDAARLALEQADLILERQSLLVEQYGLICEDGDRADAIRDAYLRYRMADCASLAKATEVAATNLEFSREYLKSILDLRKKNVATKPQVILAELDVEREEKRLADARRRAAGCRQNLSRPGGGSGL